MSANYDKLDALTLQLEQSINGLDFEKLDGCDEQIRHEILRLRNDCSDEVQLTEKIDALRAIYLKMIDSTSSVREKLGKDLRRLNKDNHAINQYLGMGR